MKLLVGTTEESLCMTTPVLGRDSCISPAIRIWPIHALNATHVFFVCSLLVITSAKCMLI